MAGLRRGCTLAPLRPWPAFAAATRRRLPTKRAPDRAIQEEDYACAAALRGQAPRATGRRPVRGAGGERAFLRRGQGRVLRGDAPSRDHVYVVHPLARRISGYEIVMQSWELEDPPPPG